MHLQLIPNAGDELAPDWNELNVISASVVLTGPGSQVEWTFSYKTNNDLSGYANWHSLASITNPTRAGTWSVTFRNDTNVTLSAPGGGTVKCALPPEVAERYADPVFVYYGIMANDAANYCAIAVISSVGIDGPTVTPLWDDFHSSLDTNIWFVNATAPAYVKPVPTDGLWLSWSIPDAGFLLETNSNPANPSGWNQADTSPFVNGAWRYSLLTTNPAFSPTPIALPADGALFFRLKK
ncbi:MAG: hypothetical protein U1F98_16955 [Verrucomicrobiota bacterium]